MKFSEKLVISFPLAHLGKVSSLINFERDVYYDSSSDLDKDGRRWWHAEADLGLDENGNEYPYKCIANGIIINDIEASTDGLFIEVRDALQSSLHFFVRHGVVVNECL